MARTQGLVWLGFVILFKIAFAVVIAINDGALLQQALLQKGVREADAEKAINYVFKDSNSDGEEESTHGLSKTSIDKLLAQASKQWLRGRDATKETRKTRIIRWLQYRGFNWGVVNFIVKKLESQCPP